MARAFVSLSPRLQRGGYDVIVGLQIAFDDGRDLRIGMVGDSDFDLDRFEGLVRAELPDDRGFALRRLACRTFRIRWPCRRGVRDAVFCIQIAELHGRERGPEAQ